MENPESQMKIAAALIKMLRRPAAAGDARQPVLREWGCRTLTNFAKVNRKIEGFLRDDATLLVLLSCLGDDKTVNQEVVNVLSDLARGDSSARGSILRAGGLDSVLQVAAAEAQSISAALPEQALTLAAELVRSFDPKVHRVATVATSLCALLPHSELRVRQKTLECYSTLIDNFGRTDHPMRGLLEVEAGVMPRFLLSALREQNELCGSACGLLRSLCRAEEEALRILVSEGLFDSIVSGISASAAGPSQSEMCGLIVSLVELLYAAPSSISVGDDVDVAAEPVRF